MTNPASTSSNSGEIKFNHLQLVSSIIDRMAGNSFQIKSWVVTLVSAVLTISFLNESKSIQWISVLITVIFCGLDTYYLYLERVFRNLYTDVVSGTIDNYSMDTSTYAMYQN